MIALTLIIVALVFEFVMTGQSQEVQDAVSGFRGFLLVSIFLSLFLWAILGIGAIK